MFDKLNKNLKNVFTVDEIITAISHSVHSVLYREILRGNKFFEIFSVELPKPRNRGDEGRGTLLSLLTKRGGN